MCKNKTADKKEFEERLNKWAEGVLENMGIPPGQLDDYDKVHRRVIDGLYKIYSETAIRCFLLKQNYGSLDNPSGYAQIKGPCGDTMAFHLILSEGKITTAQFTTDGCEPSVACGQMVSTMLIGLLPEEVLQLEPQTVLDKLGTFPEENHHCALLAVNTAKAAIQNATAGV